VAGDVLNWRLFRSCGAGMPIVAYQGSVRALPRYQFFVLKFP
jgi:hypothetical protein